MPIPFSDAKLAPSPKFRAIRLIGPVHDHLRGARTVAASDLCDLVRCIEQPVHVTDKKLCQAGGSSSSTEDRPRNSNVGKALGPP
jgi:hypothetical protein